MEHQRTLNTKLDANIRRQIWQRSLHLITATQQLVAHLSRILWWTTLREKSPYSEFFWSDFSLIGLSAERYSVFIRIQSE